MEEKKFKYAECLSKIDNCPSATYSERDVTLFRWVHHMDENHENDFKPVCLIKPNRSMGNDDKTCMGYGLSLFDSFENALKKYRETIRTSQRATKYIESIGRYIIPLKIASTDGVMSKANEYGHITFHEYNGTDLSAKISLCDFKEIITDDGTFIN